MDAVRGPNSIHEACAEVQDREIILTRLVDSWQTPLLHTCCMLLGDDALAQDAVQETFLKAWKALDKFRGQSSEKTWLFRIAVNVCRDMKRSRWFRYVDRRVEVETLPLAAQDERDEQEELAQAILRLPDRDREVILLHYYQHMNVRDMARTLGIVPSSVSNRLNKARAHLRALLEGGVEHG